jgi:hypothetical protein
MSPALANPAIQPAINRDKARHSPSRRRGRARSSTRHPKTRSRGFADRAILSVAPQVGLQRAEIAALTVGDLHQNRDDDSLRVHAQTRPPRCPRDEAADRCTDTRVSRLRLARGRFCHGRAKRSLARYDRSLPSVASRSSNRRLSRVLGSSGFYDAAPISLLYQDVHVEGA